MKYILAIIASLFVLLSGCHQERFIEEWPDRTEQDANGRNGTTEKSDTVNVTPEFDINGWEGSIDADFTFGGEETDK